MKTIKCKYCGQELNSKIGRGSHFRHHPACSTAIDDEILRLYKKGKSTDKIAMATLVTKETVRKRLRPYLREELSVKAEEAKVATLPVEKTLGEQLLDAAFEHRDRMLLAEGNTASLKEQVIELEAKVDSLEGYKIKYEQAIQDRAKQFITHGD